MKNVKLLTIVFTLLLSVSLLGACGQSKIDVQKGNSSSDSQSSDSKKDDTAKNDEDAEETEEDIDVEKMIEDMFAGSKMNLRDDIEIEIPDLKNTKDNYERTGPAGPRNGPEPTIGTIDGPKLEVGGMIKMKDKVELPLSRVSYVDGHPIIEDEGKGRYCMMPSKSMFAKEQAWQKWDAPTTTSPGLSSAETDGLGHRATVNAIFRGEKIYKFSTAKAVRCVLKNDRLSSQSDDEQLGLSDMPKHFDQTPEEYCVSQNTVAKVNIATKAVGNNVQVRWVGSSAVKFVPATGTHQVKVLLTARIGIRQHFAGAAASIKDGADVLLSTSAERGASGKCGLQRILTLNVTITDGKPVAAKLFASTENFSTSQFSVGVEDGENAKIVFNPYYQGKININQNAISACYGQFKARTQCMGQEKTCTAMVHDAIEKSFGTLRRYETQSGTPVIDLFEENAKKSTPVTTANGTNPLSIETITRYSDVIELKR